MGKVRNLTCICKILVGKPARKKPHWRRKRRLKDNIKIYFKTIDSRV